MLTSPSLRTDALEVFASRFGSGDVWAGYAPGRVNLIGDHTDYTGGLVLPMTIDRGTWAIVRAADGPIRVWSEPYGSAERWLGEAPPSPLWQRYVFGIAREIAAMSSRPTQGADVVVAGDVPVGAGLSSSASLVVSLAMAFAAAWDVDLDETQAARLAQRVEHVDAGVNCGIMDQVAVRSGRAGSALLLDCRDLEVEHVPIGWGVVAIHSGVGRSLAGSAYNARRAAVERAGAILSACGATDLGDAPLRGVTASDLEVHADALGDLLPRARHVVTENARVLSTANAFRRGDGKDAGRLMTASHASLRTDYEVSGPELDTLVDLALESGALGARLTGAGFGGCVVALTEPGHADTLALEVAERYRARTGLEGEAFVIHDNHQASVAHTRL